MSSAVFVQNTIQKRDKVEMKNGETGVIMFYVRKRTASDTPLIKKVFLSGEDKNEEDH